MNIYVNTTLPIGSTITYKMFVFEIFFYKIEKEVLDLKSILFSLKRFCTLSFSKNTYRNVSTFL